MEMKDNNVNSKKIDKGGIVFFLILLGIAVIVGLNSGNSSSSSKNKYNMDYVTNPDGTRTWYDTNNNHIVNTKDYKYNEKTKKYEKK